MMGRCDRSLFVRILALVLALVILVMVPVHAYASSLVVVAKAAVDAAKVLWPLVAALGVYAGVETGFFESVIDGLTLDLKDIGYIEDGKIQTYISDGKSFVHEDLLKTVRDWLFDSGTLEIDGEYPFADFSGYSSDFYDFYQECLTHPYHFLAYNSRFDRWYCYYANLPYELVYNESRSETYGEDHWNLYYADRASFPYSYMEADGTYKSNSGSYIDVTWITFDSGINEVVSTPHDLTLGRVSTPSDTDEDLITKVWIEPIVIEIPSTDTGGSGDGSGDEQNDKKLLYPLSVHSTIRPTITQDEAQTGETDIEPESDPEGDSGSGEGSGNTGTETPGSPSGSWTPPSDMGQFTLDLRDYFPFCIPFDLYDFFACLNADPVAPVIEWVIPMPGGDTYPLELDLSTFDSVAQLLRRLQLLLFCVGLAFKTRDLIKG